MGKSRTEGPSVRPMPEPNGASTPAFLPVSIRDAGAAGQLEIELANSCVVWQWHSRFLAPVA